MTSQFLKSFSLIVIFLSMFSTALAFQGREVREDEILSLRVLSHNNVPRKLAIFRNDDNWHVVDEIIEKVIFKININEELLRTREELRLVIINATERPFRIGLMRHRHNGINLFRRLIGVVRPEEFLRFADDDEDLGYFEEELWLQDFGEVTMAYLEGEVRERALLLDINRSREFQPLVRAFSRFLNANFYKYPIPSRLDQAGNYGGNIEVTPNDILYIGSTATDDFRDFFFSKSTHAKNHVMNTNWLEVGHVDEMVSTVITKDECGFAVTYASPQKFFKILRGVSDEKMENSLLNIRVNHPFLGIRTERVQALLAQDYRLLWMLANERALLGIQVNQFAGLADFPRSLDFYRSVYNSVENLEQFIRAEVDKLVELIRSKSPQCQEIEVIPLPVAFSCEGDHEEGEFLFCGSIAPNVVNKVSLRRTLMIPDPKLDIVKNYVSQVLGQVDQESIFIDPFPYHLMGGQLHCGTNMFRLPNEYVNPNIE